MIYRCIQCGHLWGEESSAAGPDAPSFFSDGLCRPCARELLKTKIRKNQLARGHFDCFGKGRNDCDQVNCLYSWLCIDTEGRPAKPFISVKNGI